MASNSYLDNSGLAYFLTKLASWIPSWFPSQEGQGGKVLTTDGSSLSWTAQSGGDALDGRISNCLTQIPQDVKLELSGRTFTLKAGSKVYVPNGVGNFDVVTIESDVSPSIPYLSQAFLCFDVENNTFKASSDTYSGTTAPSSLEGSALWYDTANNKIKYSDGGTTWSSNALSLPIAIVSSNRSNQSIDKVFIGFGYIGSTVFVLPNVKGLIPDGRNADGTLKNIPFVCTSVLTRELTGTGVKDFAIQEGGSTIKQNSGYVLNVEENLLYASGTVEKNCVFASGKTTNGKITAFTPKTTFHAVDINDKTLVRLVETWKSSDRRLWYRKWSDGWVEQGGYHPSTGSWTDCAENLKISFNIPFGNSKNTVQITMAGKGDLANPTKVTTANFTLWIGDRLQATDVSDEFYWYACGY